MSAESPPAHALLKFQIGPVQDFIARARSTRDLWSGSYLLSWLVAAGIRELLSQTGTKLIFPSQEGQPLLNLDKAKNGDHVRLLTPNLPNLFVARVPADEAPAIAKAVEKAVRDEWKRIANAVWGKAKVIELDPSQENRFNVQVDRHLSIAWQITPETGDYRKDYESNGWQLDAVRQTRDFKAWEPGSDSCEKDSLSGIEEAVMRGEPGRSGEYRSLFKHPDHLGAVGVIKRVWHLAYLQEEQNLKTGPRQFVIRSTRGIAARDISEGADDDTDLAEGEKYLAAIAFDGDSIGKWVGGDLLAEKEHSDLETHHDRFSAALSDFAMNPVHEVIAKHDGFLIYAGGDDVVALVPADAALGCAIDLREVFRSATKEILGRSGETPDASAGIAIAHVKSPLQDLIREAQRAEKRAKNVLDRSAFSISLMKRSGEISHWGAKWDKGGPALYTKISSAMADRKLSAKFPHRVCQLLDPYVTIRTGLGGQTDLDGFDAAEVIRREFAHALSRQSESDWRKDNEREMLAALNAYLTNLGTDPQTLLRALIDLCVTVAFAARNRPDPSTAEKQPVLA